MLTSAILKPYNYYAESGVEAHLRVLYGELSDPLK